jgi:hypothetical protein
LSAPEQLLASDHAIPSPELANDPVTMIQGVFDAMDRAAQDSGLSDRGIPTWPSRRECRLTWGAEADSELELRRARLPETLRRGYAWPWGNVVWKDPAGSTFLYVNTDWDGEIVDVLAWGANANQCLAMVERALDRDDLWE